jgi:hypothetical protein
MLYLGIDQHARQITVSLREARRTTRLPNEHIFASARLGNNAK